MTSSKKVILDPGLVATNYPNTGDVTVQRPRLAADIFEKQPPVLLEYVRAQVARDQLQQGVDLLRGVCETSSALPGGLLQYFQVWQALRVSIEPAPTLRTPDNSRFSITISHRRHVVDEGFFLVVGEPRGAHRRFGDMCLLKPGEVLSIEVWDPQPASDLTSVSVEIYGWEVVEGDVEQVKRLLARGTL